MGYLVKAPYVTLRVRDGNGTAVVQGFYAGAVVDSPLPGDSLDKHVRQGMVEEVSAAEPDSDDSKPATVNDVLADVGDDKEKASAALETEKARGDAARSTLLDKLQAVLDAS